MEARATLNGPSVSKTFVAAVLVLVAMGLGAMGGYAARGLGASGASTTVTGPAHAAPGTVLRQDNPAYAPVYPAPGTVLRQDNPSGRAIELPAYLQNLIDQSQPRQLLPDDPGFIEQYTQKSAGANNQAIGTRGDHGELQ